MAIITLAGYKAVSGISSPNQDAKLQPLVDMVNEYIPLYCNTKFEATVVTGARLTQNGTLIILPHAPIISIEAVGIIRSSETTDSLATTDYIVDLESGTIDVIDYTGVLPTKDRSFTIDYTYGFSTVPNAIVAAAYELVRHYEKREFNKQKDLGNGQSLEFTISEVIPVQIKALLDVYRVL